MNQHIPKQVDDLHDDTFNTVIRATDAVLVKLRDAQVKHGLTRGWQYPPEGAEVGGGRFFTTAQECVVALKHHLEKGEIVDSIAYLMFLKELEGSDISEQLIAQFK